MSRRVRRKAAPAVVRCSVCGTETGFAVYEATLHVRHLLQTAPGRWRQVTGEPRRMDTQSSLLVVCVSCAHPVGAPTPEMLRALSRPPRRRSR